MTYWTDDARLDREQRRLDAVQERARTCRWCRHPAPPPGFGPCECPEAMAEHRRIMSGNT
jgi:hypothetical protein